MDSIRQCSEQLIFGDSVVDSKIYSSSIDKIQKSFQPSLPVDILVDFTLKDHRLMVNLRGINFTKQIPKSQILSENHLKSPELMSEIIFLNKIVFIQRRESLDIFQKNIQVNLM
jgi:hypothetical protein